ncbi:AAA family ATPase [Streptomyces sp. ISL-87]|uniref:AAA family ATPase n=1 Tax=Streptomyces sp. ISL-87 TaxID=2819188 RepID=UPI0025532346|nr:hypothetical protein [Streptomyces sp. ISL-87]
MLTGLNSSGKSTVLQALSLLRQSYEAGVLEDGGESGLLLNGEFVQLGTGQDVRHEAYPKDDPDIGLTVVPAGLPDLTWRAAYGPEDDLLRRSRRSMSSADSCATSRTRTGRTAATTGTDVSLRAPGGCISGSCPKQGPWRSPTSGARSDRRGSPGPSRAHMPFPQCLTTHPPTPAEAARWLHRG